MLIQTSAQTSINAPIERVFDWSIDCQNLPRCFTGYQVIPAILSATTSDGLALHEGSTRIVYNSDGSKITERIISLQRPTLQTYELIDGFKPPFSWLVHSASGKWSYQVIDAGTLITWQFEFEMRHLLAYVIFRVMVKHPFQTAQNICLANLKHTIEDAN